MQAITRTVNDLWFNHGLCATIPLPETTSKKQNDISKQFYAQFHTRLISDYYFRLLYQNRLPVARIEPSTKKEQLKNKDPIEGKLANKTQR